MEGQVSSGEADERVQFFDDGELVDLVRYKAVMPGDKGGRWRWCCRARGARRRVREVKDDEGALFGSEDDAVRCGESVSALLSSRKSPWSTDCRAGTL